MGRTRSALGEGGELSSPPPSPCVCLRALFSCALSTERVRHEGEGGVVVVCGVWGVGWGGGQRMWLCSVLTHCFRAWFLLLKYRMSFFLMAWFLLGERGGEGQEGRERKRSVCEMPPSRQPQYKAAVPLRSSQGFSFAFRKIKYFRRCARRPASVRRQVNTPTETRHGVSLDALVKNPVTSQ